MNFTDKVSAASRKNNSLVCVGLDTDIAKIPVHLINTNNPIFKFNKAIIDATANVVCCYKPQIAYYAASGAEEELEMTIQYIHKTYPDIPVILDAKRGDIGATATMYAKEAFERYDADAVTVNPYMGGDTLEPYLQYKDRGVIILCRTSNPGGDDLQNLKVDGKTIYQIIANKAVNDWNKNQNVLLVVGATYPEELENIRSIVGDMTLLVPGIGAQGGSVEKAVKSGKNSNNSGMIINSSRGIIYADKGENFADAARQAAKSLKDEINLYR